MSVAVTRPPISIGEVLLGATRLTAEQLAEAVERQEETGEGLIDAAVGLGLLSADEALGAVGGQLGLPVRTALTPDDVDTELTATVPIAFARASGVVPLRREALRLAVDSWAHSG